MKNFLAIGIAAAALAASANPASATTLIASTPSVVHGGAPTGNIYYTGGNTSGTPITPQWISGTISDSLGGTITPGAVSLFTYCIDLKQYSGAGTFNVVSLLSYLGGNTALYNKFAALIAAEGAVAPGTTDHDAAVQMAVWELAYETAGTFNINSNAAYVTSLSVPADGTLANSMLTSAVAGAATPHPTLHLWVAQNDDKQDLLFWTYSAAVPEPATWGMMLLGFGLVGRAMRARRNTAVSFA